MKRFKVYAFATLIAGLLFSFGCSKDSDDDGGGDDPTTGSNYRIQESISYQDTEIESKDVYAYAGEKISSVTTYDPLAKTEWEMELKDDVTYPDANTFEIVSSDYDGEEWEMFSKKVVSLEGGLWQTILEYSYNGADWITDYKTEYSYNSGKIVKEEDFWFMDGEMINSGKTLYSWIGDVPSASVYYDWEGDAWVASDKDTLTFANGKIVEIKTYDYNANDYIMKMEFQYIGETLSSVVFYANFGGTWDNLGTFEYTYDSNGNITEQEMSTSSGSFSVSHTYETGKGNLLYFSENTGWLDGFIPYKSGSKSSMGFQDIKELRSSFLKK